MAEVNAEKPIRRRVEYHGHVQGVGFRMTTASIAKRHPVVGYVKNLGNGTVELVAEGVPAAIDQFLAEIDDTFAGSITDCILGEVDSSENFTKFSVRY